MINVYNKTLFLDQFTPVSIYAKIKKLYKAVEDDNELYVFTKLLLNTGARLQGVYNISFNHIDFSVNQ